MGIFDALFSADASEKWPAAREDGPVTLDLREPSIDGVKLGDPADSLRQIGRPTNRRPFREGSFVYSARGLICETENDQVDYFAICFARDDTTGCGPGEAELITTNGDRIRLTGDSLASEVLTALGDPDRVDTDDDEKTWFFRGAGYQLELEASPNERIRRINLLREG